MSMLKPEDPQDVEMLKIHEQTGELTTQGPEGRLCTFSEGKTRHITANFSPRKASAHAASVPAKETDW